LEADDDRAPTRPRADKASTAPPYPYRDHGVVEDGVH